MYTFSVFKLLFILISLAEVRMSSAGGWIINSFETRMTWNDAVAYCKQLNGSYQLIGIPDYTGPRIDYITSYPVDDLSGFIWFKCHLLQNSSLKTGNISCREGSGSMVYEQRTEITLFSDEGLENVPENVQNNNSCLAYSRAVGNKGFTLKNCSDEGIVHCISATMTTDHITSDPSDFPDATSIEPQATSISPTQDFLSSILQESTEAVASGVSSTVNTSPESTRSATAPLVSGRSSAESTENGDDPVPSQGSTTPTVLRGTSISPTTTEKELSTVPQGSEDPRSSTTPSRVRPPNLVSTTFKKNVSQKQGTCGTGDGFPVRSVLQCASACLGATKHPCQGYDLNRNSDGGLECVLNTGSGHAHSECDFFKDM